jgi:hypothetical protein
MAESRYSSRKFVDLSLPCYDSVPGGETLETVMGNGTALSKGERICWGTEGSNPSASSGESGANSTQGFGDLPPSSRLALGAQAACIGCGPSWSRSPNQLRTKIHYQTTRMWHFVDIELAESLASACFGHPPLPPGIPASTGPPRACVVDKIDQFAKELGNPATPASVRLLALKFLLHFVGDLHQPLHAGRPAARRPRPLGFARDAHAGDGGGWPGARIAAAARHRRDAAGDDADAAALRLHGDRSDPRQPTGTAPG